MSGSGHVRHVCATMNTPAAAMRIGPATRVTMGGGVHERTDGAGATTGGAAGAAGGAPFPFDRRSERLMPSRGSSAPRVLHGEPNLLAVRELEGVSVGIRQERPVADGRPSVLWTTRETPVDLRLGTEPIDLL